MNINTLRTNVRTRLFKKIDDLHSKLESKQITMRLFKMGLEDAHKAYSIDRYRVKSIQALQDKLTKEG